MKKQYIAPKFEVIKIETQNIVCTSMPRIGEVSEPLSREMDFNFDEE